MPFCPKCGTKNEEGALFCRQCGTAFRQTEESTSSVPDSPVTPAVTVKEQAAVQANSALSSVVQREKIRAGEVERIDDMLRHFRSKQKLYDDLAECRKLKTKMNDPSQLRVEGTKKAWPFMVIGPIVAWPVSLFIMGGMDQIVAGLIVAAIGIGILVYGIVRLVKNKKLTGKYVSETSQQASDRLNELTEKINSHYNSYGKCELDPADTEPKRLEKLKTYIVTGKADTIEEAVKLLHKES